jgi:pyrimidine deaminase RibD-like protein
MTAHARWYALARKLAVESPHPGYTMAAVIVRGGRVVAHATNGARRGQHAERRALRLADAKGATIYVARADGGCSKPCELCYKAIVESGAATIVYHDWGQRLIVEAVNRAHDARTGRDRCDV